MSDLIMPDAAPLRMHVHVQTLATWTSAHCMLCCCTAEQGPFVRDSLSSIQKKRNNV